MDVAYSKRKSLNISSSICMFIIVGLEGRGVISFIPHCSQAQFSAKTQEEAKGMHVRMEVGASELLVLLLQEGSGPRWWERV